MRRIFQSVLVLAVVLASTALAQGRLQDIQARGELRCGVNAGGLAGFASVGADGEWSGFDVDYCRAIAAAVLGDANAVAFRGLSAQERFTAVQTGEVDVLIRNSTWTLTATRPSASTSCRPPSTTVRASWSAATAASAACATSRAVRSACSRAPRPSSTWPTR